MAQRYTKDQVENASKVIQFMNALVAGTGSYFYLKELENGEYEVGFSSPQYGVNVTDKDIANAPKNPNSV